MAKLKRTKREARRAERQAEERKAQAEAILTTRQQQLQASPLARWYIKYDRPMKWGVAEERDESNAETLEAAAQEFAQGRGEDLPKALGRGKFQLPSGLEFRVYRPRNVISRGIDEERAVLSLATQFKHGYAVRELSIWGEPDGDGREAQGRADLTVFQPSEIYGFEIKTAKDSLTNFARQRPIYEYQFHRCVLAVTSKHAEAALEAAPFPWGVALLSDDHEFVRYLRLPEVNPRASFSPTTLLSNLWLSDLHWILARTGPEHYGTRVHVLRRIQQRLSPPYVMAWSLAALIARSAAGGRVQCWQW